MVSALRHAFQGEEKKSIRRARDVMIDSEYAFYHPVDGSKEDGIKQERSERRTVSEKGRQAAAGGHTLR